MSDERRFAVGDKVRKLVGYDFDSVVVSVFNKTDGQVRLVCEDDRGLLHIFNQDQMERISDTQFNMLAHVKECTRLTDHVVAALISPVGADAHASARTSLNTMLTLLRTMEMNTEGTDDA